MTNLTEQWKKGELPEGWYWIKDEDEQTVVAEYYAECIDRETNETECVWSCINEPEQVLAKVPSYEEYQKLLSDQLAKNEGEEINAELKELLKECRPFIQIGFIQSAEEEATRLILLTKIDEVLK